MLALASALLLYALADQVGAVAEPAQPLASTSPNTTRLPAGTQVEVELVDKLGSATSHVGDKFAIRLAAPISKDGVELAPAGATGQGEVIDAAHAGMSGRQGKLIISARHLELNGQRVKIRGMTLLTSGKSHVDLATGVMLVPYVGLGAMLIQGGEIEIPAGTRAMVRLAEDVDLSITPATQPGGKPQ